MLLHTLLLLPPQVNQAQARLAKDNDNIYYHRPPVDIPEDAVPAGKRVVEASTLALPSPSPLASAVALAALAAAVQAAAGGAGTGAVAMGGTVHPMGPPSSPADIALEIPSPVNGGKPMAHPAASAPAAAVAPGPMAGGPPPPPLTTPAAPPGTAAVPPAKEPEAGKGTFSCCRYWPCC